MGEVNQKYLKDEEGNIFSPVINTQSVYMKDGNDLHSTLSDGYVEHLIFSGSLNVKCDQSNSFDIRQEYYNYSGSYGIDTSNSQYFTVNFTGFYKINTKGRFADGSTENDMCLYIVIMNHDSSEFIRFENWQHKRLRLTIFNEAVIHLEQGQKVAIAAYNLSQTNLSITTDVNVYTYIPYNWNF